MAKTEKKMATTTETEAPILPSSYTKETASNILRNHGVVLRHKDVTQELYSKDSIYKKLLLLPALAIHNQTLLMRIMDSKNYVQERLTNIIFAVSQVKANYPNIKEPLSEKRKEEYRKIQDTSNQCAKEAYQLGKKHNAMQKKVYDALSQQIIAWRNLCRNSAHDITNELHNKGMVLPEEFADILQKHLERSGTNQLSANEISEMQLNNLSYADMALACALREVKKND